MSTFNHQSRTTKKEQKSRQQSRQKICQRKFKKRQENPQTIFLNESQSDYFLNINSKQRKTKMFYKSTKGKLISSIMKKYPKIGKDKFSKIISKKMGKKFQIPLKFKRKILSSQEKCN